jgi:hypothetical protein
MSEYYIGALAFSDFNAISHGRPKGSRNGYTTMANYKPIGKPAKGKYDPRRGYYVYDNPGGNARFAGSSSPSRTRYEKERRSQRVRNAYSIGSAKYKKSGTTGHYDPFTGKYTSSIDRPKAKIGSYVGYGANRVKSAYNTVSRYAKTTYKTVSEAVSVYKQRAQKAITQAYSKAANWVNSTAPKVREKVQQAIGVVRSCYNTAVSKVSEFGREAFGKVKSVFKSLFGGSNTRKGALGNVSEYLETQKIYDNIDRLQKGQKLR